MTVFRLPSAPGASLVLAGGGALSAINTLDIFGIAAHQDSIWVMSTDDLRRFHAPTLLQVGAALPLVGSPAPRGGCHPLDVGPDGTVWVGTDAGVHAYGQGGSVVEYNVLNSPLAGDEVRSIRVDPVSGVVWIGTATGLTPDGQPAIMLLVTSDAAKAAAPTTIDGVPVGSGKPGPVTGRVVELFRKEVERIVSSRGRASSRTP